MCDHACRHVPRRLKAEWQPSYVPVVLTDVFTPPTRAALLDRLSVLPLEGARVERSSAPAIKYFSSKKPLAKVRGFEGRHTVTMSNLSISTLMALFERHAAEALWHRHTTKQNGSCDVREWHYCSATNGSAALDWVRAWPFMASVLHQMKALAAASARTDNASVHSENLWLGAGGVTAFNHYDASHNAFAQVHGRKVFRITVPRAAEARLQPYSYLHPHFRRTQRSPVDSEIDSEIPPCQCACGASELPEARLEPGDVPGRYQEGDGELLEAHLEPGDVLILPPFFFHHVSALEGLSVALNAWAHDAPMLRVQRAIGAAGRRLGLLPMLHASAREVRAAVLEAAAVSLVRAVGASAAADNDDEGARAWLHSTMVIRWQTIRARYPKAMLKLRRFCAGGESARERAAWAARYTPAGTDAAIQGVAADLRALREQGGDGLEMANFVEQAALDVLDDVRTTGSFLTHCFAPNGTYAYM